MELINYHHIFNIYAKSKTDSSVFQAIDTGLGISEWVLIGTAIFLGAVALLVPYLAEIVKRKLFQPDLVFEFQQKPPDCHKTINRLTNPQTGEILHEEPVFYFRFQIKNDGKTQAKKCEAVIEKLYSEDSGGTYIPFERYTPVNLIWGSSYGEFVDINPGRRFFCDLFNIPARRTQELMRQNMTYNLVAPAESGELDLGIILNVKAAFYSQPNYLPEGRYKVDVAIYSENAQTIRRIFIIAWSGNWRDSEENMFKEVVVK